MVRSCCLWKSFHAHVLSSHMSHILHLCSWQSLLGIFLQHLPNKVFCRVTDARPRLGFKIQRRLDNLFKNYLRRATKRSTLWQPSPGPRIHQVMVTQDLRLNNNQHFTIEAAILEYIPETWVEKAIFFSMAPPPPSPSPSPAHCPPQTAADHKAECKVECQYSKYHTPYCSSLWLLRARYNLDCRRCQSVVHQLQSIIQSHMKIILLHQSCTDNTKNGAGP